VSYDMGWQQRSSGRRYASPSGHAFFVGGLSRKPIQLEVKSKICNFCSTWKKRNPGDLLPVPLHSCTMNHDGSSSSMEAAAALTMIVDLFETKHVSVARICIDDDASTPSMLKWSNADYMKNNNTTEPPLVPKTVGKNKGKLHPRPDNGKLPAHVPEPSFCCRSESPKEGVHERSEDLVSAEGCNETFHVWNGCAPTRQELWLHGSELEEAV
jgi:hypothetical protein